MSDSNKPETTLTSDDYKLITSLRVPPDLMARYLSGDFTIEEGALVQTMQAYQQLAFALIATGGARCTDDADQRLEYLLRAIELVGDVLPTLHAAAANTLGSDDDEAIEKLLAARLDKRVSAAVGITGLVAAANRGARDRGEVA